MPDKSAKSVLHAIQAILAQIKILHGHVPDVSVRFHSDMDKSFEAEVRAYCTDKAYVKTFTEGYDSDSNSIVERRNGKLKQGNRTLLLSATGGRLYYEELWDLSMMQSGKSLSSQPHPKHRGSSEQQRRQRLLHQHQLVLSPRRSDDRMESVTTGSRVVAAHGGQTAGLPTRSS